MRSQLLSWADVEALSALVAAEAISVWDLVAAEAISIWDLVTAVAEH